MALPHGHKNAGTRPVTSHGIFMIILLGNKSLLLMISQKRGQVLQIEINLYMCCSKNAVIWSFARKIFQICQNRSKILKHWFTPFARCAVDSIDNVSSGLKPTLKTSKWILLTKSFLKTIPLRARFLGKWSWIPDTLFTARLLSKCQQQLPPGKFEQSRQLFSFHRPKPSQKRK